MALFVQVINMDAFSAFSETSYDSKSIHESSSSSSSTADPLFSICSYKQLKLIHKHICKQQTA